MPFISSITIISFIVIIILYIPPFEVTEEILSLVAEVSEIVGHLSATVKALPSFQLRKTNRIRTIQSSLAIENNSLSVEQVTIYWKTC